MLESRMSRAAPWWIAAVCILMAMAAWIGDGRSAMAAFDREGLAVAHSWRNPWLDAAFPVLTWLGSMAVLLPLVLGAGVALWRRGFRREAGFLVAAVVGASAIVQLAKHAVLRPRPDLFAALVSASPLSFPSAHAAQATALALASWILIARLAPRRRWRAVPVLVPMLALVGVSRLYLQVHYPSDVLAGILAAALWVAGLHAFMFAANAARRG